MKFQPHATSREHHPLRGYLLIAFATFLWGVSAVLGRAVFTGRMSLLGASPHAIDPLILSQTRAGFSLLILLPILLAIRGWQRIKLPIADLVQCFFLGTLGIAVSNYFYYVAIQRTNVATAIIVQYTAPVWVLFYVVARGQQKFSLQKVVAVALAVTESRWSLASEARLSSEPSRMTGEPFTSIPTASSPRSWPRSPSPSTTSADTASWLVTTAGACSSGR